MVFHKDNIHCKDCGAQGYIRKTCPLCPCNYCKTEGHSSSNCPKLQKLWCEDCKKQGHKTGDLRHCPLQTRTKATGPFSAGYEPKKSKHRRQESDIPSTSYKQPRLQQEGGESQTTLEYKGIGNSFEDFPKLEEITRHLIMVLRETSKPELIFFKNYIHEFGDLDDLCNALLDCIDPEIRGLEGRPVTHGLLENIRRSQELDAKLFHCAGGYLDFVTDKRDDTYCRFYVGQSHLLAFRIHVHVRAILSGSIESLHYYICTIGMGNRNPNFVRLFRISTPDQSESKTNFELCMLEMVMALAFRSLPDDLIVKFSPMTTTPTRKPTIHLNVLSPLEQGSWVGKDVRLHERQKLLKSVDPEIQSWPQFRAQQITKQTEQRATRDLVGLPSSREYLTAFKEAIGKVLPSIAAQLDDTGKFEIKRGIVTNERLRDQLALCAQDIKEELNLNINLGSPLGSLNNKLAIIYGTPEYTDINREEGARDQLPYRLDKAGLTAENSISWPIDFGASRQLQANQITRSPQILDYLSELTLSILDVSEAQVVLVSGKLAQRYITRRCNSGLSPLLTFIFRGQSVPFWLDLSGNSVQRVYFDIPDLEKVLWGSRWQLCHHMSLALKLASLILGLPDIKFRYYENCSLRTQIFDTLRAEDRGEVVSIAMLGDCVKQWLYRRGFQTDLEIEELCEASGGGIGGAMHILCCALSASKLKKARKPAEKGIIKLDRPGPSSFQKGRYTTKSIEAVKILLSQKRQLWEERHNDKESANAVSSDSEIPAENADVEELLGIFEDDDYAGQKDVNDRQVTNPVNQELDENEPMDDELSLEASIQFSSLPIEKSRRRLKEDLTKAGRKVTKGPADTLKTQLVRAGERISRMINGGMDLNAALLGLGGVHLKWDLPEELADVVSAKGALRVWIEFQSPIHTQAWYPVSSEPHLRTFAFKAGMPNASIEEARYFWPTIVGGTATPDRDDVRAATRVLAALIVRTKYESHRSS